MDITHLIAHPEDLDQETLYDLRRLVALHPTYHAARILFLQNLFLLHDPTFDQELRRAALLVPDRRVIFNMTQAIAQQSRPAATHKPIEKPAEEPVKHEKTAPAAAAELAADKATAKPKQPVKKYPTADTTQTLLEDFLSTTPAPLAKKRIKADPSTDYMTFLLQQEEETTENAATVAPAAFDQPEPASRLDSLIDSFITSQEGGIKLPENPMTPEGIFDDEETAATPTAPEPLQTPEDAEPAPAAVEPAETKPAPAEESPNDKPAAAGSAHLSEALAQAYIKQEKYERAIEVLSKKGRKDDPQSSPYLADQVRFLQKLAAISAQSKRK